MKPDLSSNKSTCSLTISGTSCQSSESSAYIDEEEMNNIKKQETPCLDDNFLAKDKSMTVNTKNRLHNHVLLLKREHRNRILMISRSERTILRDSSTVHNFLNYKAAKSERSLLLKKENNKETMLAPKNYIRDQVWDEHRRRFPTKKEQEEHQEVLLPAVDTPQLPSPTFERRKQLQRIKSFPERRRSSLLRQQSFPRGLQDSNRYNHQDFLQDELDFEEKFLLPDEDKRRTECQKSMLPSPSTMLCEVSPRLLESRRKNKANMSNFLFNSSLLWNSFKHSLKPDGAGLTMKVPQEILFIIKVLPGNDRCFDCNTRHDLVWAFVPHGTILCESCGFKHLSSVRDDDILSFSGDLDWKFKELISLLEGGNRALLSFLKQRSIENREHELVATAIKEQDFSSLYNSKTASQYRKFMRKKVQSVVMRYRNKL